MKLLKLREDRRASVDANGRIELLGPKGRAVVEVEGASAEMLRRLREGILQSDVRDLAPAWNSFVAALAKHDFLIVVEKEATRTREWIAHATSAPFAAERAESSSVVVIGCGGTGSIVADHLVRFGIRRFTLIDDAVLDLPDMNRQLPYRFADVGTLKVSALAAHLREFGAEVRELPRKLDSELLALERPGLWGADLIFCCADTPPFQVQAWASRLSSALKCPIVFGSVGISDYVVGPLLIAEHHKEAFRKDRTDRATSLDRDGARIMRSSVCINNTMAAVEQAWLGIRYLLDPAEVTRRGLDNTSTIVDIFNGKRNTISWTLKTSLNERAPLSARGDDRPLA